MLTLKLTSHLSAARAASVKRQTKETRVDVSINIDGDGVCNATSQIPFLDHMLDVSFTLSAQRSEDCIAIQEIKQSRNKCTCRLVTCAEASLLVAQSSNLPDPWARVLKRQVQRWQCNSEVKYLLTAAISFPWLDECDGGSRRGHMD